ncbi:MAG: hypothetical protein U0744_00965 [Gemmataceae bacterium]
MDFFQGIDWGAYAAMRFKANQMPGLASFMQILHLIGTWGWIPLLAAVAIPWRRGGELRRRAMVMFGVAIVGLACMEAVRWSADRRRPPDAEITLGPQTSKSFPNVPAFAFPLAGMVAVTAWGCARQKKQLLPFLAVGFVSCIFPTAELFLGLAFVSDVITGMLGGVGFGLLARVLAERFARTESNTAIAALQ